MSDSTELTADESKFDGLIEWLEHSLRDGGDFLKQEAPEVAREIVEFGFWSNLVIAIVCITTWGILMRILIPLLRKTFRIFRERSKALKDSSDDPMIEFCAMSGVGSLIVIACAILLPCIVGFATDCLKAKMAPRVYVLEWISKEVGK